MNPSLANVLSTSERESELSFYVDQLWHVCYGKKIVMEFLCADKAAENTFVVELQDSMHGYIGTR